MARKQARYGQTALYNATPVVYNDGDDAGLQVDANGNTLVSIATKFAGEDLVNDVLKVENRYNYNYISTSVTTTVKTGSGFLHAITVENAGATGNAITIYDNTAGSGTVIANFSVALTGTFTFNVSFTTGLTIVNAGTTSPNLTVSYR